MTIYERVFLLLILTISTGSAAISLIAIYPRVKNRHLENMLICFLTAAMFACVLSFVMIFVVLLRR